MIRNDTEKLLSSLSADMTSEELALSTLQALTAAEISMKRQELGLSQAQLAEKMGVKQSLVSKWESGDVNYTLKTLVQIARCLDIEIQTPFVLRKTVRTYENNVIPLHHGAWTSGHSSVPNNSSWENFSLDAKEM